MQTKEKKQTTLEVDRGMYQYLRQISGHGAGIPSRGWNRADVRTSESSGSNRPTKAICRVRVPNVDPQPNLAPSSWSVYMMTIRSNNDIEGWHHGLHRRASGKWHMPFYMLLDLLHQEARLTALRIRLVSEKKLKRIQRAKYRSLQAKVFALWDDFSHQRKNAQQLLRECARLNGPSRQNTQR